jgi:hypothetical protein
VVSSIELLDHSGKVSDLLNISLDHSLGVVNEDVSLVVDNSGLLRLGLRLRSRSRLLAALL